MHPLLLVLFAASFGPSALAASDLSSLQDIGNEITASEPLPPLEPVLRSYAMVMRGPESTTHVAGEETVLSCLVKGHPAPRIQWLRNEVPIQQDDDEANDLVLQSDSSLAYVRGYLRIISVSARSADQYTCVAHAGPHSDKASATVYNDHSTIPAEFSSLSALNRQLLAAPRAPLVTQFAHHYLGQQGTTLVMPCRATGLPRPEVYWTKNGKEVDAVREGRAKTLENGDLVFTPAIWEDMGPYQCSARNEYGEKTVESFLYPLLPMTRKQKLRRQKELTKN